MSELDTRTLVRKHGAKPTHEGAEAIPTDLAPHLDSYSAELCKIYDPIFAQEYRRVVRLYSSPRYDLTLYPPRDEAGEPVEAKL